MNITASPEAVDALKRAIQQVRTDGAPETVRVYVAHQCGCGNTKFQMGLDAPEEGDSRVDLGGVTLLVDPMSAESLEDARLDVVQSDNLLAPQFSISTASNGGGGCGCGGHHHHAH